MKSLHVDKAQSLLSEVIVLNYKKDKKLRAVIDFVKKNNGAFPDYQQRVEFLLKVVRQVLGSYGFSGGPSNAEADAALLSVMKS